MKHLYQYCFIGLLLGSSEAVTSIMYRSQSQNSARDLAGGFLCFPIDTYFDDTCTQVGALFEYSHSFRTDRLVKNLFGIADKIITIQGSQVEGRQSSSWLADYFGLPPDFSSRICITPTIKNYIIDLTVYHQWNTCNVPIFFELHLPIVRSKWNLNYKESILSRGKIGFAGGYFTDGPLQREFLLNSFTEFVSEERVPDLINGLELTQAFLGTEITARNAVRFEPLHYSKWSSCTSQIVKTKVSDIHFDLGLVFAPDDRLNLAASLHVAFPTGNTIKDELFFEPRIGNGHHWEVGGRIIGYAQLWENTCGHTIALLLNGMVSHLFATQQCRVFDLLGRGCASRYMLAQKLGTPVDRLFAHEGQMPQDGAQQPVAQFYRIFSPIANLTFQPVTVSAKLKSDISLALRFSHEPSCVIFDLGYNVWYRSKDDITLTKCTFAECWALKGDAHVFGFTNIEPCSITCPIQLPPSFGSPIPLSATQQTACITTGRNYTAEYISATAALRPSQNPGVDNPAFAQDMPNASGALVLLDRYQPESQGLPIQTSFNPLFLSQNDLNYTTNRGLSHKLFASLLYQWKDHCISPFVSLGSEVEFGKNSSSCACEKNLYCSVSQWGIWFKGGVTF
jgi:hypothetical protein